MSKKKKKPQARPATAAPNPMAERRGISINTVLTVVVVLFAAFSIGGALLSPEPPSEVSEDQLVVGASMVTEPGRPVTMVEFLDYQCPACSAFYDNLTVGIEQDYADRITFATRNFPLEMHALAPLAAQAAEAAENQGRYTDMYHLLYDEYPAWAGNGAAADEDSARERFTGYAERLGLDVPRFLTDLDSDDVVGRVDADMDLGEELGVFSTPTFFIDGRRFEPAGSTFAEVDLEIRAELDRALAEAA